ncbi:hypothetical protein Q3G72_026415 [Acer saccharum]|nr:hypothetical protein Q3G72_026415 [Acer saccharum]
MDMVCVDSGRRGRSLSCLCRRVSAPIDAGGVVGKVKKMVDLVGVSVGVGVSGLRRRWWKVKNMVEGEEEDAATPPSVGPTILYPRQIRPYFDSIAVVSRIVKVPICYSQNHYVYPILAIHFLISSHHQIPKHEMSQHNITRPLIYSGRYIT